MCCENTLLWVWWLMSSLACYLSVAGFGQRGKLNGDVLILLFGREWHFEGAISIARRRTLRWVAR